MSSEWDYRKAVEADPFKDERNGEGHDGVNGEASSSVFDGPTPARFNWPDPLAEEAFYGVAGEVVRLISPHTEADPAAVLIQMLLGFGNVIGRRAYFTTDGARQFSNLFAVIVGITAKARKGTSWNQVRRILRQVDEEWSRTRVMSGLASGEGLVWQVRDPIIGQKPSESDPGIADKRLQIVEPEFSRVLRVMERGGQYLVGNCS